MSYGQWEQGFQDTYDDVPGIPFLDDWEQDYVEDLFERGFTHHSDESGYNEYETMIAREEFFDYLGLVVDAAGNAPDFPWDEWREAMGYE